MMKTLFVALAFLVVAVTPLRADGIKTERVQFESGRSGASIEGTIKGHGTMHYLLGAKAGQAMGVKLATKSTSAYFNIFAPGTMPGQDEALFIGDTGGDTFEGVLPENGDYLIQVYLYRSAARKNEKASFTLNVEIAAGSGGAGVSGDAKVPGTDFNATGEINCARAAGQPFQSCKFGVVRRGNGSGDLTVFWPDGGSRVIVFEGGVPSGYNESEADGGAKLGFSKTADLFSITIGGQRFEFPEAVIFGG